MHPPHLIANFPKQTTIYSPHLDERHRLPSWRFSDAPAVRHRRHIGRHRWHPLFGSGPLCTDNRMSCHHISRRFPRDAQETHPMWNQSNPDNYYVYHNDNCIMCWGAKRGGIASGDLMDFLRGVRSECVLSTDDWKIHLQIRLSSNITYTLYFYIRLGLTHTILTWASVVHLLFLYSLQST